MTKWNLRRKQVTLIRKERKKSYLANRLCLLTKLSSPRNKKLIQLFRIIFKTTKWESHLELIKLTLQGYLAYKNCRSAIYHLSPVQTLNQLVQDIARQLVHLSSMRKKRRIINPSLFCQLRKRRKKRKLKYLKER